MNAGYHEGIDLEKYIADPAPRPSLSTGIVETLCKRTAEHAHLMHPRLGGAGDTDTARGDVGSAVHAKVFGGKPVVFGDWDDWRTKDSKAFRDDARAQGMIPMLAKTREQIERMAANVREALKFFGEGRPEVTMLWEDAGVWCRARADWLTNDGLYDLDLKTCSNADPEDWSKHTIYNAGYDTQMALRARGHEILSGQPRTMVWVLVEIEAPHAVSFVGAMGSVIDLASIKVKHAVSVWGKCLGSGEFPTYPRKIHWVDAPSRAEYEIKARGLGVTP